MPLVQRHDAERSHGVEALVERSKVHQTPLASAKLYWRDFIFAWLEPVILLIIWPILGALDLLANSRNALIVFLLVVIPAFWFADHKARRPLRSGQIPKSHFILWAMIIPFAIWTALIALIFVLLHIMGE